MSEQETTLPNIYLLLAKYIWLQADLGRFDLHLLTVNYYNGEVALSTKS